MLFRTGKIKKEIHMHLRQFSTNKDHPDAEKPLLWRITVPSDMECNGHFYGFFRPDIQVVGNILILSTVMSGENTDLCSTLIFDWQEGLLLKVTIMD